MTEDRIPLSRISKSLKSIALNQAVRQRLAGEEEFCSHHQILGGASKKSVADLWFSGSIEPTGDVQTVFFQGASMVDYVMFTLVGYPYPDFNYPGGSNVEWIAISDTGMELQNNSIMIVTVSGQVVFERPYEIDNPRMYAKAILESNIKDLGWTDNGIHSLCTRDFNLEMQTHNFSYPEPPEPPEIPLYHPELVLMYFPFTICTAIKPSIGRQLGIKVWGDSYPDFDDTIGSISGSMTVEHVIVKEQP